MLAAPPVHAQDETPFTRLFDTGLASAKPLAESAVAQRAGWHLIPEDTLEHKFSGDAVLANDKLVVVLRKQGQGAEVYPKAASGLKHRASLGHAPLRSAKLDPLVKLTIIENNSGAVMVEGEFRNTSRSSLRFRLTTGEAILEIRPDPAAPSTTVLTQTRHVVVPDYFGDDVVYSPSRPLTPARSPSDGARVSAGGGGRDPSSCLPAENFCLSLLEGGDAIMMSVWQSSEQTAWLTTADSGAAPPLCASSIQCLEGKSLWLAFLESPDLWHAGSGSNPRDWKPPFPAKWRCSRVRVKEVADSWDLEQGPNPDQTASLAQALLVVYPIDRTPATPLTVSCPTDVMRNTLGVGPCQYILACEGLSSQGDPTPNSVMTWVEKQFEQKKQKRVVQDIQERLEQMTQHVAEARTRLEQYAQSAHQIRVLLANQPNSDSFQAILSDLDRFVAAGLAPTVSLERARQLSAQVAALIGQNNGLDSCRLLGEQLRSIGAIQDSAMARCRMAIRRLRAEGRMQTVNRPEDADLARALQRLTESILQRK